MLGLHLAVELGSFLLASYSRRQAVGAGDTPLYAEAADLISSFKEILQTECSVNKNIEMVSLTLRGEKLTCHFFSFVWHSEMAINVMKLAGCIFLFL